MKTNKMKNYIPDDERQTIESYDMETNPINIPARSIQICKLRLSDTPFNSIAKTVGLCNTQTGVNYRRALWKMRVVEDSADLLSYRAASSINNAGVSSGSKDEVIGAIRSGKLKPGKLRNYGKKTHSEVLKWCGLPEDPKPQPQKFKTPRVCPHCGKLLHQMPDKSQ